MIVPMSNWSRWSKLAARIFGRSYLRHEKRRGWTQQLPIYLAYCKQHGFFESYLHGHKEHLICPKCETDR